MTVSILFTFSLVLILIKLVNKMYAFLSLHWEVVFK